MASKDSEFKPAQVHVPAPPKKPAKGSGEAKEVGHDVLEARPQFTEKGLEDLKKMVAGSDPGEVSAVAESWKKVRVSLVGDSWNEGIKKHFDDAVTKVLQTWHGHSADQFAAAAQKISDNFANLALYPHNTGEVLRQVSDNLRDVKKYVEAVKKPSKLESAEDWAGDAMSSGAGKGAAIGSIAGPGGALVGGIAGSMFGDDVRDDSQLKVDLQNSNMSIWDAMNKNAHSLSLGKKRQLEAAHYMEQLGTTYRVGAKALGGTRVDDGDIKPPHDGSDGGPGPMPMPNIGAFGPTPSGPKGGGPAANIPGMKGGGFKTPQPMEPPRPNGIDGGIGGMSKTPAPQIGTGLSGFTGGGGPAVGGGAGAGGIGGGLGGGVGSGGLGSPGSVGGGSGPGVGGAGMPGMVGGAGAGARAGGAGAGAGAKGGRAGMPGMGGAAGGAKGAGAKGAAGGKGGALARQKGGVVGGKGGKAGAGGQGGSGLHRSRGGTQKGATGARRPAGMAGAHGAHGAKGKDKGNENGQRPDYLVEDEETWTPERNVAPKVIE
ncbi:WXG100 family type VII secretion target [Streptomyces sp. YGL11-2]|uniref:WXG100 family type VII secretion target n=1 Tax=Streptomyces sp. YGL11-2 TaxID=3414028 RepID=UPI003CE6C2BD